MTNLEKFIFTSACFVNAFIFYKIGNSMVDDQLDVVAESNIWLAYDVSVMLSHSLILTSRYGIRALNNGNPNDPFFKNLDIALTGLSVGAAAGFLATAPRQARVLIERLIQSDDFKLEEENTQPKMEI